MTKRMAFDVDVAVPAAVMYRDFTTVGYWEDLVLRYREEATRTEIAHFSTDHTGTRVAFAHILTAADLPAIARPVLPGTFVVTREQHFDPFDDDTGERGCEFSPSHSFTGNRDLFFQTFQMQCRCFMFVDRFLEGMFESLESRFLLSHDRFPTLTSQQVHSLIKFRFLQF